MRRLADPSAQLLLAAALASVAPAPARAQTELVVDAGIGAFAGGDFAGLPPGPALGLSVHATDWGSSYAGFDLAWSRHGGSGVEGPTTQLEYVGLIRGEVVSGLTSLHVGAKLGLGRRWLSIVDEPAAADGFIIGPSAALRFPFRSLRVQLTLDALYQTYEELILYGFREYGTDEDGLRIAFRAGLVFPLPALGRGADDP